MADISSEVHITGSDLPEWATETTAEAMAKSISELVEISGSTQRQLVNELKTNGKVTEGLVDTLEKGKTGLGADLDKAATKALDTASGLDKVNRHLPSLTEQIKEMPKTMKMGIAGFGMLAAGMSKAIAIIQETAGVLKNMNDSGIIVEGGIRELQSSLAKTGMTLDEMSEITSKYAQVVGTNGWKAITNLTNGVNALDGGFRKYGLTTAEATEYTAEYLEQQRMAGVFGAAAQRGQSTALKENVERLTAYSKTLNISRKAMMETTTSMLSREDVQAQFALMTPEARAKAQEAFAATVQGFASLGPAGEKFGSLLTDMIANPTAEASESFKQIAQAAPELAGDLANMSKRVKNGEKISQQEIMNMLEKAGEDKKVLEALKRAGGEIGAMADSILVASLARENAEKNEKILREKYIKENGEFSKEGFEEWKKTSSDAVQGVTGVDDAMAKLHATIQNEIAVAFMDLVGDAGGQGVLGLISGIDQLTGLIASFGSSGFVEGFRSLFDIFGKGLGGTAAALTALSALVIGGPSALVGGLKLAYKGLRLLVTGSSGAAEGLNALVGPKQLSRFKQFATGFDKTIAGMGKFKGGLARLGLAGAALTAGFAAGTLIYKTLLKDTFANKDWKNYDPNAKTKYDKGNVDFVTGKVRTPEEQRMHLEMREKRRKEAAVPPTTSTTGAPTQTTPVAPSMSEADVAKLDKADQQLYYLKKIARQTAGYESLMA